MERCGEKREEGASLKERSKEQRKITQGRLSYRHRRHTATEKRSNGCNFHVWHCLGLELAGETNRIYKL